MSDAERLASALATDLDGHFERFVRVFQDRIYAFALRLTASRQDAEEATQDTFVRAYRALAQYPPERRETLRLQPWLYQIALNVVRNRVRRPRLALVSVDGAEQATAEPHEQPEEVALRAEGAERVARLLLGLPRRYATAVVLRHVQGLSYAELAEVLGQPIGTAKSDVHRGLRLLREALDPELLVEAGSH
jgi:RNA polymerase sigma-70 factor (ECF subfamily)